MIANPHESDGFCCFACVLTLVPIALIAVHRRENLSVTKLTQFWNDNDLSRRTLFLTVITFLLAVVWLFSEFKGCKWGWMEPLTTLFGLTTGLLAIAIDPHSEKEKKRNRIITDIKEECQTNSHVLSENANDNNVTAGGIAYRRLLSFAIHEALTSGLFLKETELTKLMKCCRINFDLLNVTLMIVELRMKSGDRNGNLDTHRRNLLDSDSLRASKDSNNYLIRELENYNKSEYQRDTAFL